MHDRQIVVVEDDEDLRRLFVDALSTLGEVVGFGDIYQALARLRHDRCDLLVLDQLMPGATGTDLVERLGRESIDVPILVVTGMVSTPLADRLLDLGVHIVLPKPVTPDELLEAATEVLSEPAPR